jgi:hypothetical protein
MMNEEKFLTSMLHTVQMGQTGIRSVMKNAVGAQLKTELKAQLKEYDALEKETLRLAESKGFDLKDLNPALETMSTMMSKVQLMGGEVDSKIAGMLIQGNTRGMILGLKNLRKASKADSNVRDLAQRLLNRENMNIQKSQQFL